LIRRVLALVHAWLILDFFGANRRSGEQGSSLTTAVYGQSFIGLVFAAILLPDRSDGSGYVAYAAANLSLSTLLMGIAALADPARAQRARADEVLLRTTPIGRAAVLLARALHAGFALCTVTIGIALPPAILSYWCAGGQLWVVPAYLLVACVLAGLVSGALTVLSDAAALLLGQARGQLVTASFRGLLLAGGFVGFALCLRHLRGTADDLPFGRTGALLWPPYWGARWLHDPAGAAGFALALAGGAAVLAAAALALQRLPARAAPRIGASWLARLDRRLAGAGPLLGVTAFTSAMMYRSPSFRAKALPILLLPAAMVALAMWQADARQQSILLGVTLQLPAIYLPILVAFLAPADEEKSGWVFATSPLTGDLSVPRHAALLSLTTHVLTPVHAIAFAILCCTRIGLGTAALLSAFSWGAAVIVARFVLRGLPVVPFTDESEGTSIDGGSVFALAFVLGIGGGALAAFAGTPWAVLCAIAAAAAAARCLLRRPDHA
jgi:hypothetical protein